MIVTLRWLSQPATTTRQKKKVLPSRYLFALLQLSGILPYIAKFLEGAEVEQALEGTNFCCC